MKVFYRLMAPGKSQYLLGKKLKKERKVVYYSSEKYVFADTEEIALQMIRDRHHLNPQDKDGKWHGFRIMRSEG